MVITIIGILIALLLPAVQAAREAARRTQCADNIKQLALAMHGFHERDGHLPEGMADCCFGTWMMRILPFVEQDQLFALYVNLGGPFGPGPLYRSWPNVQVTCTRLTCATCPSDTPSIFLYGAELTKHNYAGNYGNTGLDNSTTGTNYTPRANLNGVVYQGAPFGSRETVSFNQIPDGLSNTLLLAEIVQTEGGVDVRGCTWWGDGAIFTTYLAPNSSQPDLIYSISVCDPSGNNPPCGQISAAMPEMYGARSRHPGGVQTAMCDGSVHFIADVIDINLWRALSTTHGGEPISVDY